MRTRALTILLFTLCSFMGACSKRTPQEERLPPYTPAQTIQAPLAEIETSTIAEAESLARNSAVLCADEASCVPSVGMLVGSKQVNGTPVAYACTASLIAANLVITNAHCIPEDLRHSEASCANQIWIHLPGATPLDCRAVRLATNGNPLSNQIQADIAILELAVSSTQSPLRVAGNPSDALRLVKIDPTLAPTPGAFRGIQKTEHCRKSQGNIFLDENPSAISFGDCALAVGNSGSPLLNEQGVVTAIFQEFTSTLDDRRTNILSRLMHLEEGAPLPKLGFASRISLLSLDPVSFPSTPPATLLDPIQALAVPNPIVREELTRQASALLASWLSEQGAATPWIVREVGPRARTNKIYAPVPSCQGEETLVGRETRGVSLQPSLNSVYELSYTASLLDSPWVYTEENVAGLNRCP